MPTKEKAPAKAPALKCGPDEILAWVPQVKNIREIAPDIASASVDELVKAAKKGTAKAIKDGKCIPKPKGGGGGKNIKELAEYKAALEEKIGSKVSKFYK